jgi:hypothetical protein
VHKRIIAICARWNHESRHRDPDDYAKALGVAADIILRELGGPYLARDDYPRDGQPAPIPDEV